MVTPPVRKGYVPTIKRPLQHVINLKVVIMEKVPNISATDVLHTYRLAPELVTGLLGTAVIVLEDRPLPDHGHRLDIKDPTPALHDLFGQLSSERYSASKPSCTLHRSTFAPVNFGPIRRLTLWPTDSATMERFQCAVTV